MSVEILDPAMQRIAAGEPALEQIATGLQFTEGPVWDRRRQILIFSDIPANRLYRYSPADGSTEVFREPSRHANGNTLDRDGRLVSCEHSGRRVSRTEADGTVTALATHHEGKSLSSPNDVVVRGDGAIYFTDPPYGIMANARVGVPAEQELPYQGVFRIDPSGVLTLVVDDFDRPNGLAFSPDERTLYIDDSARRHIRVFTVGDDGSLQDGRLFAELIGEERGVPDGMKVDREGNVYCTGPGGVWVLSPQGAHIGTIRTPEATANLAWGGDDWRTLYLTSSTSLFRIRLGVAGVPVG
jgi:gluconolactonase